MWMNKVKGRKADPNKRGVAGRSRIVYIQDSDEYMYIL